MSRDPAGLYARLGVDPSAPPTAIRAAFRRKARILHPDVPKTGNAVAFVWVKEAYEVLSNPSKRAAYDRSARTRPPAPLRTEPEIEEVPMLWPKFSDLPLALWIGFGAVFCLASGMAVYEFTRPASRQAVAEIRPAAPTVAPLTTAQAKVVTIGVATHYVLPGGGAAMVWQRDAARDAFLPAGRVADFTSVEVLGILADSGLVGIRLAGGTGFIDPDRLAPGDQNTAHRAYCAYNAGAPPTNGEVLSRRGNGSGRLTIENRGSEPTVVKLRGEDGQTAISVFVKAGNATTVTNLPAQPYRPDFAVGELWSRACDGFTAGMRAERFVDYSPLEGLSPLVVPPNLSVSPAPVDIPDAAFGQD